MPCKRILLVDDEPSSLAEYRTVLANAGDEWEFHFAGDADGALAELAKAPFDVLVADMHKPGDSGTNLLNKVGEIHPKTIRFILAGEGDKDFVMSKVLGAHQFLAKPCDLPAIQRAIERTLAIDSWLSNQRIKELVSRIRTFPSIPSLYFEVLAELRSVNTSTQRIGEIISKDLAMTTKMLQVLNSAYYGLSRQVTDPSEAVGILGFETVKSLVMAIQALSQYDKVKPIYFSIDRLWRHSTSVARIAREIVLAEGDDAVLADVAFTAGLMHDIGKLVLVSNFDEQYHGAVSIARKQQIPVWEIEKEIFGANHGEVGAYLLGLWGLPLDVVETAALHHFPSRIPNKTFSALTAVHVANVLEYEQNPDKEGNVGPKLDDEYLAELGLTDRVEVWRERVNGQGAKSSSAAKTAAKPASTPVAPAPASWSADSSRQSEGVPSWVYYAAAALALAGLAYWLIKG